MRTDLKIFFEGIGVGITFLFVALWKSMQLGMFFGFPLALLKGFLGTYSLKLKC